MTVLNLQQILCGL